MSRHRLTLITLLGAGMVAAGALTGCATGASSPDSADPSSTPSAPDATPPTSTADIGAAWVDAGRAIALVTWGSSSCPPSLRAEPTAAGGALTVDLAEAASDECTEDLAPRATLVPLPAGIDPTGDLSVTVTGAAQGDTVVTGLGEAPAVPTEFAPSAGWVNDSLVAIVTYGSSSCVPTVEAVSSAGADVAVQFATPPADQICTMDYAPRVSLADIGREAGSGEVSLVLSGGGVTSSGPIPVLGAR